MPSDALIAKAEEILDQSGLSPEDMGIWKQRLFGIFADDDLLNDFITSFGATPTELGQATVTLKQKLTNN